MYFWEIVNRPTLLEIRIIKSWVDNLFTALLHCNASDLLFEIMENLEVAICISVPHSKLWGFVRPNLRL